MEEKENEGELGSGVCAFLAPLRRKTAKKLALMKDSAKGVVAKTAE